MDQVRIRCSYARATRSAKTHGPDSAKDLSKIETARPSALELLRETSATAPAAMANASILLLIGELPYYMGRYSSFTISALVIVPPRTVWRTVSRYAQVGLQP